MAKKKRNPAAEDLMKALIEDVNNTDDSKIDHNLFPELENGEAFNGPSAGDEGFQTPDDIFSTPPLPNESTSALDKTIPLQTGADKTIAINQTSQSTPSVTPSKPSRVINTGRSQNAHSVMVNVDASLVQAENLKFAQQRILELEREVDQLRSENDEISSAAETIKSRVEEMTIKLAALEKEKEDTQANAAGEIAILKGQLQYKEAELAKTQRKIDELEVRLKNDFKKVRVRERELENRLELVKAEKATLTRAKDESILELKRKVDQLQGEIDNYREKCLELNKTLESHKEQFKRTVRALKLALTNLEVKEEDVIPFKKAE
jgi:hypothetical protein